MSVQEDTLKSDIDPYQVPEKQFASVERRQYYGGFAWFSHENSEFMLSAKADSVKSLENMR
jgi:hypothetical protein